MLWEAICTIYSHSDFCLEEGLSMNAREAGGEEKEGGGGGGKRRGGDM